MTLYEVNLVNGQHFLMEANMSQASAPIRVDFHGEEDSWQSTPYQTADANHDAFKAAELAAEYFSTGEDDCIEVENIKTIK